MKRAKRKTKQTDVADIALKALKEAVRGVIEEHKRDGRPLVVWRNNRVMWVSPYNTNEEWIGAIPGRK